ncbi:MAG: LacI family transcriptional regulator [Opitutaceae bacterium]|nr:LacI family transcriptional regulator [Opitutaceae bacterium]
MISGIRTRAERLGYCTDIFWTREPDHSLARLGAILRARGITGIILGPLPERQRMDDFPWANFSAVAYGYMLESPHLHHVQNNMYENMREILARFGTCSFKRIGFITDRRAEDRLGRLSEAYFGLWQKDISPRLRFPLLEVSSADDAGNISTWVRKHRLDAVVSQVGYIVDIVRAETRPDGRRVAFAWLASQTNTPDISGMAPCHKTLGAVCLDMVATMIAHGERGIPAMPRSVLIPGVWREGITL